ncbi:UvrD-helicase domain-containing protein [Riemerella columbina]|uniref:UvrD-helicase domain-containing protein n=1 Tax=Riemerella columbina TaxID=103810 RepID=UPI0026700082|nr:UvrD-helicase domain-containing protein [Riemerella columbina]WKS96100.1 UvrD-helicase domain-containing protein [Riemerella columbina]
MYSYNAISASAGSGKTYTLAMRVLALCLRTPHEQEIKHILALTFTNKAANEMKERILSWLESFTHLDFKENTELKAIQNYLNHQGIKLSLEDLHQRAQRVLDYILHHYSVLNISTIDKFNSKLVRHFSYELGLAQNFNLEINNEPYLIEAVEQLLDQIGEDSQVSEAFMDFVNYNLDNEERINVNQTLYERAKTFVSDVHYEALKQNENFDWTAYEHLKEQLRNEIQTAKEEQERIANQALDEIQKQNLNAGDFYGGQKSSLGAFFREVQRFNQGERSDFPFPKDEAAAMIRYQKGTASKDEAVKSAVEALLPQLLDLRTTLIKNYVEVEKKKKILKELLPLKINKEIGEQLALIEAEDDLVLLSKFNILIKENLKDEPSAFIYEKIGTRFQHYFFDEFQDTSQLQWENMLPLRDHTIYSEDHSFTLVGDPKQSIYRFRGGDSEQMLDIINRNEKVGVPLHLENLGVNWRSAKHIVEFNNQLYAYMAQDLAEEKHRLLFSEQGQQQAHNTDILGRVKVNLVDYDRANEVFFDQVAAQMYEDIKECVANGFSLQDICILCRTKKEIQELSLRLGREKIQYQGRETYIKTISEKGLTLDLSKTILAVIAYLRWENEEKNTQYLVEMLYHLNSLGRIRIQHFTEDIFKLLEGSSRQDILENLKRYYGLDFQPNHLPVLNLYNKIEHLLKVCAWQDKETDYLLNFLEEVYAFTQNGGKNLNDFIKYWDEEISKTSVQASENIDAIKMLTIHAAKGLEFPVVFLPMKNANEDSRFNDWFAVDYPQLKSVNLNQFNKDLVPYDEALQQFSDENTYKNKIDRFCVQYVATTRPVEQLFLYLQKPSKPESNKLEILDFVQQFSPSEAVFDVFPEENGSFRKQIFPKSAPEKVTRQSIKIFANREKQPHNIRVATPSKSYQARNEKVKQGIFIHDVLAKINTAEDVEKVLKSYWIEGTISTAVYQEVAEKIKAVLANPKYQMYFDEAVEEVINERDILYHGEFYRPDRIVKRHGVYYIIDFKTGAPKSKDEQQIAFYKTVLEQLGKTVAGTEILYL